MGNYHEYMACLLNIGGGPLRELEPQVYRPHAFGNPFKIDKKSLAIDEVIFYCNSKQLLRLMKSIPRKTPACLLII